MFIWSISKIEVINFKNKEIIDFLELPGSQLLLDDLTWPFKADKILIIRDHLVVELRA